MTSQREVERQYKKLLNDVATNDYYKVDLTNRINTYGCGFAHLTVTIDRDAGVTPMFLNCVHCGTQASSAGYQPKNKEHLIPTHEWFRPSLDQCLKMRNKNSALLDHILRGGLELRPINS